MNVFVSYTKIKSVGLTIQIARERPDLGPGIAQCYDSEEECHRVDQLEPRRCSQAADDCMSMLSVHSWADGLNDLRVNSKVCAAFPKSIQSVLSPIKRPEGELLECWFKGRADGTAH